MRKIKNKKNQKLHLLNFISFLLGFQAALVAYVTSSYLKEVTGMGSVGIFYFLGYGGSLLILLNTHHLIKRHGKSTVFFVFMAMKLVSLLGVAVFSHSLWGLICAVWILLSGQLMWTALDVIVESFSQDKVTGTIRGQHLAIMNTGWLLAPFLAAKLVAMGGYSQVYFIGAVIVAFVLVFSLLNFRNVNHNIKRDIKIMAVAKKLIRSKNVARIYYAALILEIFYAAMVIYTPLYLLSLGWDWIDIGKIFTVMLVPFVILQYPVGVLADRKTGEKVWILVSLVIMAVFTGMITFMDKGTLASWMFVLFFTRVGAAILEVVRDSYFYKQIKDSDVDLIDFYRTTRCVSYVIVAAIFTIYMAVFPLNTVFIFLAFIVLSALVPVWNLKDTSPVSDK